MGFGRVLTSLLKPWIRLVSRFRSIRFRSSSHSLIWSQTLEGTGGLRCRVYAHGEKLATPGFGQPKDKHKRADPELCGKGKEAGAKETKTPSEGDM